MEVEVIDEIQSDSVTGLIAETSDVMESTEVYNYTHESGLTVSATVEEMGRCAVLGSLPPEVRAELARAHIEGRRLQAEEEKEEEVQETETEEEAENKEDKTEQKAEIKEPKKSADDAPQKKQVASKQEAPKIEQLQALNVPKEEAAAISVIADKTEVADNTSAASGGTSPLRTINALSPEAAVASIPEAQTTSGNSGYSVESKISEPIRSIVAEVSEPTISAAVTEVSDTDTTSTEIDTQPILVGEVSEPAEVSVATEQTDESDIGPHENLQIDELYKALDSEIDTKTDYTGINANEDLAGDGEFHQLLTAGDEQRQFPEDFVEYEIPEEQANDFIVPAETQAFNMTEFAQESSEATAELSVPVEEVEESIMLVADTIEEMGSEEAETAHQILDEIIHKVAEAQTLTENDAENQEVALEAEGPEEELKELFILLFDHIEMEYTPELIESCVKLALKGDMSELIVTMEKDEETNIPQDSGTHEVIKQLLATISSIKKSAQHAYQIGKSALQLYSQELLLDLKRRPVYGDG